ncbi:carbohydrate ABC transporter permease [Alkalibacterium putridalgicola]|uniref:carbohydrate ABC transporter permease n=1 Tax=Alkalibacterium putridalgicola TaxID=426703 RepID=UPI0034CEF9F6
MVGHNEKGRTTWLYIFTTFILLAMIFPYIYLVMHSFAAWDQVDRSLIPTEFTLRSWQFLLGGSEVSVRAPWLRAFANTFFVTTVTTVLMVLFAVMVAYALAKVDFKGKKFVNNFILFQMFFPAVILLIPQFLMVAEVGLINTFSGMIVPTMVSLWAIFMYTNFFKGIPDSLIEAAKLDGASDMKILFQIVIPMSKSITSVVFLFLYTERWTNLLWDMIVAGSSDNVTLNVLISQMFGPYGSYPGPMYAASVLLTLPLIVLFLLFSRRFQEGFQDTNK